MADITTYYGYKNQFTFFIENNGSNPVNVTAVELVNVADILPFNIWSEIENTFPMVVSGNSQLDVISSQYSLYHQDLTTDLTYGITYDVVDMTDFTTVIDTTRMDVTYQLENFSIYDTTHHDLLTKLNRYFKIGPNASDTTITSSSFNGTSYPLIEFSNRLKFSIFISTATPQFVYFSNSISGNTVICGKFFYDVESNTIELVFTDSEKLALLGMVFNNVIFYYQTSENDSFSDNTRSTQISGITYTLENIVLQDKTTGQVLQYDDTEQKNDFLSWEYIDNKPTSLINEDDFTSTIDTTILVLDLSLFNLYYGDLSCDSQVVRLNNVKTGEYKLILTQDSIGNRIVTDYIAYNEDGFEIEVKQEGGSIPTLTTTPNKSDIISCLVINDIAYMNIKKDY